MRFASLGSGSEGNALFVQAGQTRLLMDCGFALGETERRLARLGEAAAGLSGIVVTHEHGDHISGVFRLARKYALPVWLTHGTLRTQSASTASCVVHEINPHEVFSIGDVEVHPYPVPHDAGEPVQYVFSDGARRLGVLTDVGCTTPHIETMLSGCDALVLEFNHDAAMLQGGDYPYRLKQRIGGRYGHLSNDQAAALLARLECGRLQHMVAAHLSQQNNSPDLAVAAVCRALNCTPEWVAVAMQEEGLDWREIA